MTADAPESPSSPQPRSAYVSSAELTGGFDAFYRDSRDRLLLQTLSSRIDRGEPIDVAAVREHHGKRQTDDVLEAHRRSTNFCTRPSSAKIATVSTRYMTTPISLRSRSTTTTTLGRPQAATARR